MARPEDTLVSVGKLAVTLFNHAPKPQLPFLDESFNKKGALAFFSFIWHPATWFFMPAAMIAQYLVKRPLKGEGPLPHIRHVDRDTRNRILEKAMKR